MILGPIKITPGSTFALRSTGEHTQYCKLSTDGLPTSGGCTHEGIIIRVVEGSEHLDGGERWVRD